MGKFTTTKRAAVFTLAIFPAKPSAAVTTGCEVLPGGFAEGGEVCASLLVLLATGAGTGFRFAEALAVERGLAAGAGSPGGAGDLAAGLTSLPSNESGL